MSVYLVLVDIVLSKSNQLNFKWITRSEKTAVCVVSLLECFAVSLQYLDLPIRIGAECMVRHSHGNVRLTII